MKQRNTTGSAGFTSPNQPGGDINPLQELQCFTLAETLRACSLHVSQADTILSLFVVISLNPQNPNFERVVRDSFAAQRIMSTLGADLTAVSPGRVEIRLPFHASFTQQHGFLHAGVVTTILDSACGYAAMSLMPEGVGVLSIEFKTNLLAPARGDLLIARAEVVRAGRTITVCKADGLMTFDGGENIVATMLSTIMTVRDRPDVVG